MGEGLTIARSLFRLRNISCFLIDLRSAMSEGSNRAFSTALAMYPTNLALLEVSYGHITRKRSSIQHYGGGPGWDFHLLVTPPCCNGSLTGRSSLCDPGLFAPPLSLSFLGWRFSSLIHHLFSLLVPLPLFVSEVKLGSLGRGKGRGFRLNRLLGHVASGLGFHQLLEARTQLAL